MRYYSTQFNFSPNLRSNQHNRFECIPKSSFTDVLNGVGKIGMVMLLVALCNVATQAQVSITSQVPLKAIDICGAQATFSVTINCGAATNSNTVSINQPVGMHYIPGTVTVTSTNTGISVMENTIFPDEDPVFTIGNMTPGNNVTFSYQASADCQLIGVNSNTNAVTFSGSAGSPAPHVTNGYNTHNGVMNITGVTNNSYLNRTLGDNYNRVISVRNGGQGSVSAFTINIANGSGLQIQNITGGTPAAALPAQSTLVTITDFTSIGSSTLSPTSATNYNVRSANSSGCVTVKEMTITKRPAGCSITQISGPNNN